MIRTPRVALSVVSSVDLEAQHNRQQQGEAEPLLETRLLRPPLPPDMRPPLVPTARAPVMRHRCCRNPLPLGWPAILLGFFTWVFTARYVNIKKPRELGQLQGEEHSLRLTAIAGLDTVSLDAVEFLIDTRMPPADRPTKKHCQHHRRQKPDRIATLGVLGRACHSRWKLPHWRKQSEAARRWLPPPPQCLR